MKKKGALQGQHYNGFDFVKLLGAGAWSDVYLAAHSDKQKCAIKVISKSKIKETPKLNQLIKTQIKVLKNCKNQNVIGYIDSFQNGDNLFIAMQYCNGGDLEEYLEKKKKLIETEAVMFLKQILNGFKGLHEVGAMHRDFKAANILLHNSVCKIADLGFARILQAGNPLAKTILGTSLTMAPQVLDQQPYGKEADIWSVGVVFYQLMYGKYPYQGYSDYDILRKIKTKQIDFSQVSISQNAKDFISKCMTIDPKKRISWVQIYQHPLIKQQKRGVILGGLGGLKSTINIFGNQEFYKKNQAQNLSKIAEVQMPQVQVDLRKSKNPAYLLQQIQKKELIEEGINKNEKIYLHHRNGIMFIMTFVEPYIKQLVNIKLNHQIYLFILFKVAYLKLLAFLHHMNKKNNFLDIKQFWDDFKKSSSYQQLIGVLKEDINVISVSCSTYLKSIKSCNDEIKAQSNIDAASPNFKSLVQKLIDEYWLLLAEYIPETNGIDKQNLIKLISSLYYYKRYPYPDVEEFGNILMNINFQEAELRIKQKVVAKKQTK